jgi:chromosome segregation ATPase
MNRRTVLIGFVLAGTIFIARVPAQQQASTQTELLTEVRLLRQAIESLTGINARVQIVFGRLQLQEQRTSGAAQRLEQARITSARIADEIGGMNDHLKDLEAAINDGRRKPEELEQVRAESVMVTHSLERLEQERLRAIANETDASNALNQEQGRWSDLNRQLDELERLLVKR